MRLLVTGASGFIGKAILRHLDNRRFSEIHALSRSPVPAQKDPCQFSWHHVDLLQADTIEPLFERIKPTHVIHGAWETAHGSFWSSEKNRNWLSASIRLLDAFERHGGQRFIFIGSMAEYDWTSMPLIENYSAEIPFTLYGETKLGFHRIMMQHAATKKFSAANGRIFNLYGPDEKSARLVPQLIDALRRSAPIQTGSAERWRDILHVNDAARALISLLFSELEGAVNVANGSPTLMADLFQAFDNVTGRGDLIQAGSRPDTPGEPKKLYADASLIRSTGWRPEISLVDGIRDLWTSAHLKAAA